MLMPSDLTVVIHGGVLAPPWLKNISNTMFFTDNYSKSEVLGSSTFWGGYVLYLHTDVRICPGMIETLYKELLDAEAKFQKPCWISPRYLPYGLKPTEGLAFAEAYGISTDLEGFISNEPYPKGNPVTTNGHALEMFMVQAKTVDALVDTALWGMPSHYGNSGFDAIDLGISVLLAGQKNLLSWNACVEHASDKSRGCPWSLTDSDHDTQLFKERWGEDYTERLEHGRLWEELWKAQG